MARSICPVHRAALWAELLGVVAEVDAEACRTKVSRERGRKGQMLYSPVDMNAAFRRGLAAKGVAGAAQRLLGHR